jgi:hypothetical protein
MFVARTDEERALLREITDGFGGRDQGTTPSKPVGELVPLTDREYQTARSAIATHFQPLREAYLRGMAIAETDEQKYVMDALRDLLGRPRDS